MANGEIEGSPYKIQTFVFLDLETLDLFDKPRILEISMIAVSREDLLSMKNQAHSNNPLYNKGDPLPLPRVCQKYTMLYYPKKIIKPKIEQITGLSNYNLQHLKEFDKDCADAIKLFLDLPSPVGIVAHNGIGFDFPILKAELRGVYKENLDGVVCIDSLLFSRHFEKEDIKNITEIAEGFSNEDFMNDDDCNTSNNLHVMQNGVHGYSPLELERLNDIPSCSSGRKTFNIHLQDNSQFQKKKLKMDDSAKIDNFQTPPKEKIEDSDRTPPPPPRKNNLPPPTKFTPTSKPPVFENNIDYVCNGTKAKKALFQSNRPVRFPEVKKKPFSQPHIFYRIYGQEYPAHRAESDAKALLQICAYHGQDFVSWADSNFTAFVTIKPRWDTKRTFVV